MKKDKILELTGWFIVFIGLAGLFLPFINGMVIIAIGLYITSRFNLETKISITNRFKKLEKKFPKFKRQLRFIRLIFNPGSDDFDYEAQK